MSNLGDALGKTTEISKSGPEAAYYAWKLMAERLAVDGDERYSAESKKVLGAISQREAIKYQILGTLQTDKYMESTAEYAQLEIFTGHKDKLAMAEMLTEVIFQKYKKKAILDNLVGGSDGHSKLKSAFTAPSSVRKGGVGIGGAISSGLSGILSGLTGARD